MLEVDEAGEGDDVIGRPLAEWLATDCPPRAVLIGKGPSLDNYTDQDACGAFVMAINEAAEVVRCDAAIYIDTLLLHTEERYALRLPKTTIVFRSKGAPESEVERTYIFLRGSPRHDGPRLAADAPLHIPHYGYGTLTAALTILGMWGVREVLLVGCDSWDRGGNSGNYARSLGGITRRHSCQPYSEINEGNRKAIEHYGITATWFHRGERWLE